jgi:hypothetical protein
MAHRYVHGAGIDDPLIWYEGATLGTPRFLHTDVLRCQITKCTK